MAPLPWSAAPRRDAVFPFSGYPHAVESRIERMWIKKRDPRVGPQTGGLGHHE